MESGKDIPKKFVFHVHCCKEGSPAVPIQNPDLGWTQTSCHGVSFSVINHYHINRLHLFLDTLERMNKIDMAKKNITSIIHFYIFFKYFRPSVFVFVLRIENQTTKIISLFWEDFLKLRPKITMDRIPFVTIFNNSIQPLTEIIYNCWDIFRVTPT